MLKFFKKKDTKKDNEKSDEVGNLSPLVKEIVTELSKCTAVKGSAVGYSGEVRFSIKLLRYSSSRVRFIRTITTKCNNRGALSIIEAQISSCKSLLCDVIGGATNVK